MDPETKAQMQHDPRGRRHAGRSSFHRAAWRRTVQRPALLREAVEQAVAAGGDEVRLAAAARHMRRVPGRVVLGRRRIALAVHVTEHGAAERAARPVVAGQVEIARERFPFHVRTGHDVVHVGRLAPHLDGLAFLVDRGGAADLVVGAVQIGDAGGNHRALGILPRTVADAIASVDRAALRGLVGAQIGAPGFATCARGLRELLAVGISARETAQVGALAGPRTGDEERHVVLLRRNAAAHCERHHRHGRKH